MTVEQQLRHDFCALNRPTFFNVGRSKSAENASCAFAMTKMQVRSALKSLASIEQEMTIMSHVVHFFGRAKLLSLKYHEKHIKPARRWAMPP